MLSVTNLGAIMLFMPGSAYESANNAVLLLIYIS